jgi:hypothetical protein
MAMGVPAHRVNLTIDVRQIGGAVNRAYEGYYKKISFEQMGISEDLNRELWMPFFKVRMSFKETYKIDEMREAQVVQILAQAALITVEEGREMMGLDPEKPKGTEPVKTSPVFGSNETSINQRPQAKDQNATGEVPIDNKLKQNLDQNFDIDKIHAMAQAEEKSNSTIKSITDDGLEVTWNDFYRIVENKIGFGKFQNANILYIEINDDIFLFFNDGSWKYKTRIAKANLKTLTGYETMEQFKIERLGNAIKLFM